MQSKLMEGLLALSAGSISYSWMEDASDITALAAGVVGVITACLAGWFYLERAMKMRKERIDEDKNRRKRRSTSIPDRDGDSVGRD
jgi:hypothetical protein